MSQSSIQNSANKPVNIFNNIKMGLNHQQAKNYVCVEGSTDLNLFRNFINTSKFTIKPVNGKKNLIDVMNLVFLDPDFLSLKDKIFGIADADFDHINNLFISRFSKNIYITDFHDIEIMMIESQSLDSLICEFTSQDNIDINDNFVQATRDIIYGSINQVGLLRYINDINQFNLNFSAIKIQNYATLNVINNIENISIDIDRLINDLCIKSTNYNGNSNSIKQLLVSFQNQNFNKLQLLSGHDFTQMLAFYFNSSNSFSNKNYNQDSIESMLRIGFHKSIFQPFRIFSHLNSKAILK